MSKRKLTPFLVAVLIGVFYGIICQLGMRLKYEPIKQLYAVMSFGYVFLMPIAMGAITVWFASEEQRRSLWYCLFVPWLTCLLALGFSIIVGWEGAICFVMAAVVFIPLSSLGGLIMYLALKPRKLKTLSPAILSMIIAAPPLSAVIEARYPIPQQFYTVATQIPIDASVARIWENIIRVPKITEPLSGTFYKMGFPKPIEATLSHEGVGGVRQAIFDKNLVFIETITDWQDLQKLSFAIKADADSIPVTTLDEHVTVGGRYFDVLQGTYEIERLDESHAVLHLSSHFRVSTRFNFYASLWARFLMADIQNSILNVIKTRCEKAQSQI